MAARVLPMPAKRATKGKAAKPSKSTKKAASAKKAAKRSAAKGKRPSPRKGPASARAASARPAATAGRPGHAHCAATDPFGDPCQNVPRRPSAYCVIHSYLDR
jgi:hypothetical protein